MVVWRSPLYLMWMMMWVMMWVVMWVKLILMMMRDSACDSFDSSGFFLFLLSRIPPNFAVPGVVPTPPSASVPAALALATPMSC